MNNTLKIILVEQGLPVPMIGGMIAISEGYYKATPLIQDPNASSQLLGQSFQVHSLMTLASSFLSLVFKQDERKPTATVIGHVSTQPP